MAKSTQLNIKVKGIDQASGVFKKIGGAAKGAAIAGAALAAAGGLAVVAFGKAMGELSKISDLASKASTSSADLQRLTTVMATAGVQGASLENTANMLALMTKNAGAAGKDGFFGIMKEVQAMDNAQDRAKKLQEVFGRQGLNLLPLVNGNIEALNEFCGSISGVSDEAAVSGDKCADAWTLLKNETNTIWLEMCGDVAKYLDQMFEGGIYTAIFKAVAWVRFAANSIIGMTKTIVGAIAAPFEFLGKMIGGVMASISELSLDPLKMAWNDATTGNSSANAFLEGLQEIAENSVKLDKELFDAVAKGKIAENSRGLRKKIFGGDDNALGGATTGRARNDLILGGSYASLTQLTRQQNESQKISSGVRDIVDNTAEINKYIQEVAEATKGLETT